MKAAELLNHRLELVYRWYQGMINPDTGMLEYLYLPRNDAFVRENCPIRETASVWDVEVLGEFLDQQGLQPLIETSLRHFGAYLLGRDGYLILDPRHLGEPSSIAHSAFMALALLHAPPPRDCRRIAALAEGILWQQRPDGSYRVYFDDLPDEGKYLYAGEAMLALLEAYRDLRDDRYLRSVERGFSYCDTQYDRPGRVANDVLVFFADWQSQAGRLLLECNPDGPLKQAVTSYIYRLHDRIIARGFYEEIEHQPEWQVSVAVACALEGLNDAYALTRTSDDERAERYRRCICTGLAYLLGLQRTEGGTGRERGGFGLSLGDRTPRIDITGHAASAFIKTVENGIECGRAG
jgi:hypothetical protein